MITTAATTKPINEMTADEVITAMFGGDPPREQRYYGMRFKVGSSGYCSPTHPQATGPTIIRVQMIPAEVSVAEVQRRLNQTAVLRHGYPSFDNTPVVAYGELGNGRILR